MPMGPNKEWRARQQVLTWSRGRGGERPLGTLLSSLGLLLQIHEFQDLSGSDTQVQTLELRVLWGWNVEYGMR